MSDDRGTDTSRGGAPARKSSEESEARDDRAFALAHRVATLEARERDINETIIGYREQIAKLGAERDALQARLAEHREREEELDWRARDAETAIADRDLRIASLEQELRSREAQATEHERLRQRMKAVQSSPTYRLMRAFWRIRAALRRAFRRRRRQETQGPGSDPPPATHAKPPERRSSSEAGSPLDGDETVRVNTERAISSTAPTDPRELRVAAVLDEMSANCFGPECDLLTFDSEHWQDRLEDHRPHLLLVESAWRGNGETWRYLVGSYPRPGLRGLPKLRALVDWCRMRDIPTAFWGKEDPIHFDRFREAAALFDYVFTTDENCVPRYEQLQRQGGGSVRSLPFAAQPLLHNPIAIDRERSDAPCFAGTYYRNRHQDRRKSLEMLLDAARPFGLVIYDRTLGWGTDAFGFPERFLPHVRGSLPYSEVVREYKGHKVFLNVNSVVDSPTMFSRRVFELLACDAAVISTESAGIERTFGDLVPVVTTMEEATEAFTRLIGDDDHRREVVTRARRLVMTEHTYRQRLAVIAQTMGYSVSADLDDGIAALALIDDTEQARKVSDLVAAISAQRTVPAELLPGRGDVRGRRSSPTLGGPERRPGSGRPAGSGRRAKSTVQRARRARFVPLGGDGPPVTSVRRVPLHGPARLHSLRRGGRDRKRRV